MDDWVGRLMDEGRGEWIGGWVDEWITNPVLLQSLSTLFSQALESTDLNLLCIWLFMPLAFLSGH